MSCIHAAFTAESQTKIRVTIVGLGVTPYHEGSSKRLVVGYHHYYTVSQTKIARVTKY